MSDATKNVVGADADNQGPVTEASKSAAPDVEKQEGAATMAHNEDRKQSGDARPQQGAPQTEPAENDASDRADEKGGTASNHDEEQENLTCREMMPSPPSAVPEQADGTGKIPEDSAGEEDEASQNATEAPADSSSKASPSPSAQDAEPSKPQTRLKLAQKRASERPPIAPRLPDTPRQLPLASRTLPASSLSPSTSSSPQRRRRTRPRRPTLPTASSRSAGISKRGRLRKKRVFEECEDNDTSDPDDANPPPVSSTRKPRPKRTTPAKAQTAAEALLNCSTPLAYSWDGLGLGQELGSAALNEYIGMIRRNQGMDENHPNLTAQQLLQINNSLRLKTVLPPPGSDLHRIVQKNRFENQAELYGSENSSDNSEDGGRDAGGVVRSTSPLPYLQQAFDTKDEVDNSQTSPSRLSLKPVLSPRQEHPPPCGIPFKNLARLYETMCAQDADDGSFNRREAQYMSADACIEHLRSLENRACALKLKESDILEKGKELGLLDTRSRIIPSYVKIPKDSFASASTGKRTPGDAT